MGGAYLDERICVTEKKRLLTLAFTVQANGRFHSRPRHYVPPDTRRPEDNTLKEEANDEKGEA